MLIKLKTLFIVFALPLLLYAQNKEKVNIIKKYAMYKCLMNNYAKADSTFKSHDYTASYIFQIEEIDNNLLDKIDKYVIENTSSLYKEGVSEHFDDEKANYICWKCIEFYESKNLQEYIKKIIKNK